MNANEFDIDFDFEKEYGIDPPSFDEAPETDDDFDLTAVLSSEFGTNLPEEAAESEDDFDYGLDALLGEETVAETIVLPVEAVAAPDSVPAEPVAEESAPEEPVSEEPTAPIPPVSRRKPISKMRKFKNDTLPLLIGAATVVLLLVFIIGSIARAVSINKGQHEAELNQSESAMNEQIRLAEEAETLLKEAAALAAGYDYQGAIDKLDSFSGNANDFTDIILRRSEYDQAKSQLIEWNDPGAVANLSFHVLVADPARTFEGQPLSKAFNMNFVTTDEFSKILDQLYTNGYVLVDMDCFIDEKVGPDGSTTYSSKSLLLPDGKKPVMISETLANYFNYMVDSDDDGEPDKDGAGFASRLVVDDNGDIKAEMVNADGQTVVGDYDLVPILEQFIKDHPDFSYHNSRALLAVTGYDGIFGYRTNKKVIDKKGQEYYDQQVEGAKKIVAALNEAGYEIACNTYNNEAYGKLSAQEIKADLDKWMDEVTPIVGQIDKLIYAQKTEIEEYSGNKYNVLYNAGFRYFINHGNKPSATVTNEYVRQNRLMVTGNQMAYAASLYSQYFDASLILNDQRGTVPN